MSPVSKPLATLDQRPTCALSACRPGARATVVEVGCATDDACRLRALGLCEGARVNVIEVRHCMLLEVRGTRLALGGSLTKGITVRVVAPAA